MTTSRTALAILALAALTRPQAPDTVEPPLAGALPALRAQSAWRLDATPWTPAVERGAFPLGNGRVFAAAGLGPRANTLGAVTGPTYGAAMFGNVGLALVDDVGTPIPLPRQRVRRVLDAAFVVAEDSSDNVALKVLYFAPPDQTRILAVVEIEVRGTSPLDSVALRFELTEGHQADGDALRIERQDARARLTIRSPAARRRGAGQIAIPRLEPGATWRGVAEIATFPGGSPRNQEPAPVDLATAEDLASATLADWARQLEGTTEYDTDHARLRDLLADWRVGIAVMQCAQTGAFAPMPGRHVATVRGQNGPLLTLLRYRMWDRARRILDLWWDATRALGRVPSELWLGASLSAPDESAVGPEFWRTVEVPPGDVGSWIVLQHFWYWRATRDLEPIVQHWPLLEVCFKKQTRRQDVLMPFAGDEPWLAGLAGLRAEVLGGVPELIGEDPANGRRSDSFASAVAFLMSLHAVGDLVDAMDRARNPARWSGGPPDPTPSGPYVRSAFARMAAIEKHYWQDDLGWFAPALGACGGLPHREPIANVNLLPLWIGWTFPAGERSRDNLRNSLAHLWRDGARIGTTRTLGAVTGDLQGMLLTALSERDGAARRDVLDLVLESAKPCGEWSTFYGADGRPSIAAGARLDPAVGGVNIDALLFAITGIRQAAYGNWDDDDIRLELRLPRGSTWFSARGAAKDGRTLDIFFRAETSMLTEVERAANDQLAPDRRRDPNVPHRRVKFVVELVEGQPPKGYYDVALNVEGTVFVRYLQPKAPENPNDPDLRRIDEMEFAGEDELAFLLERDGAGPVLTPRQREIGGATRVLVLSYRNTAADVLAGPGVTLFDTGLPFPPAELEALLLDGDGRPRHAELYLDWRHRAPAPAGWQQPFFASASWADLLDRFRAAGGSVVEPGFATAFEVDGVERRAGDDGGLELPAGDGVLQVRTVLDADRSREAVLRLGANAPFIVRLGDKTAPRFAGEDRAEPDRNAWLIELVPGTNVVEVEVAPRADRGPRALFLRASDPRGLPLR